MLLLPVAGLLPLGLLNANASWTDLLVAGAAAAWLLEVLRRRGRTGLGPARAALLALTAFVALSAVSALLAAEDRADAAVNVLVAAELLVLTVLTAALTSGRRGRNLVVAVTACGALVTVVLAVAGVVLFALGVETSLAGPYGEQLVETDSYPRVAAGFHSPPLLASYCIVAAAVLALDSDVSPRLRRALELALGVVAVLTVSRAVIGFGAALAIRWAARRGTPRAKAVAATATGLAVAAMVVLSVWRVQIDPARPADVLTEAPEPANRREALTTSLDTLGAHPILGTGPGTLPGENDGVPVRAHMTPLNVAATSGLPALAALGAAVVLLWRRRPRPTDIALWSGSAGVAIDALGQDVEHFRHVWLLIGLLAAAVVAGRRQEAAVVAGAGTSPR